MRLDLLSKSAQVRRSNGMIAMHATLRGTLRRAECNYRRLQMKKFMILFAASALGLAMVGCGSSSDTGTTAGTATTTGTTAPAADTTAPATAGTAGAPAAGTAGTAGAPAAGTAGAPAKTDDKTGAPK